MSIPELIIKKEEGFDSKPYYCKAGMPTIGYGRVIGKKGEPLPNITVNEKDELQYLRKRIVAIEVNFSRLEPDAWAACNANRRAILVSMCYQLGISGARGFRNMLAAIIKNDWQRAAAEMVDSKWYKDTPNRCARHAWQMKSGELHDYYQTSGV